MDALILVVVLAAVGGAIGAAGTKVQPWRGALVGLSGGLAFAVLVLSGVSNGFVLFLGSVLAAGIVGGSLKLTQKQLPVAGLAALVGGIIGYAIMAG